MNTHDPVSGGWWEECLLVIDKVKVRFGLVKVVGEIVRLWVHYMLRKAERMREPLPWDVPTVGDIANLERNLDL